MPGELTFNVGDVRKLITHSRNAESRRPAYEDLFNPVYHFGGVVKMKDGWPDESNLDISKLPAALLLVKDEGIYLMSNGMPGLMREDKQDRNQVVYAKEGDPTAGCDWWETARAIMGGDDCVDSLPITMFDAVLSKYDKETFTIVVNETAISIKT